MNAFESPNWLTMPVEERWALVQEDIIKRREEKGGLGFLNNFYAMLPCEDIQPGGGSRRKLCLNLGIMDISLRDRATAEGKTREAIGQSELAWDQTPRQFFETIDRTINELGIPMERILELQHQVYMVTDEPISYRPNPREVKKATRLLGSLYELVLPVYAELRVQGYWHDDLAG